LVKRGRWEKEKKKANDQKKGKVKKENPEP
jgi:hypothetical protein